MTIGNHNCYMLPSEMSLKRLSKNYINPHVCVFQQNAHKRFSGFPQFQHLLFIESFISTGATMLQQPQGIYDNFTKFDD